MLHASSLHVSPETCPHMLHCDLGFRSCLQPRVHDPQALQMHFTRSTPHAGKRQSGKSRQASGHIRYACHNITAFRQQARDCCTGCLSVCWLGSVVADLVRQRATKSLSMATSPAMPPYAPRNAMHRTRSPSSPFSSELTGASGADVHDVNTRETPMGQSLGRSGFIGNIAASQKHVCCLPVSVACNSFLMYEEDFAES